jgi:hypothetical protein
LSIALLIFFAIFLLEYAVEFCAVKAPEITKKINQQNKEWTIKRVSLKNRNPSAKPDNWERKVLKMFDKRQSNGESAKKMAYSEMVNGEFRFMKAQGVQGVCLSCHSKNIAKNIKSAIDKHYPNDKATGSCQTSLELFSPNCQAWHSCYDFLNLLF